MRSRLWTRIPLLDQTERVIFCEILLRHLYDLISVKLLRAVKLGSTKVATIAVEDFIRDMDAGLIEYDHVAKKATRHRSKAKSAASQDK